MAVRVSTQRRRDAEVAKVRLVDVAEVNTSTPSRYDGCRGYAATATVSLSGIDVDQLEYVTYEGRPSRANLQPRAGDVIFAKMKATNKVLLVDEELSKNIYSTGFYSLSPNPALVNQRYLAQYLKSDIFNEAKDKECHGVTQKALNGNGLSKLEIPLPPLAEQKRIAEELVRICELKKNAEERLGLIDQLVKSKFVEMFGDGGAFSSKTIAEMCELVTDGEHATPRRVKKGVLLLSARNVYDHEIRLDDVDYINDQEYARIAKRVEPKEGDVLLSCSGSVGRCCAVPPGLKFQLVRSVALLRFKNDVLPKFAEYLLCSPLVQRQVDRLKTASSQANLFQGKIKMLVGFVPPLALQREFAAFVAEVDKSKAALKETIATMETLYKERLQEYFS